MSSISVVKLKVRRGKDGDRQQIILDQGELGFTTDSHRLFVGDGLTYGGVNASINLYYSNTFGDIVYAQVGDLVYRTDTNTLYALTGTAPDSHLPDYSNPNAYIQLVNINNFNGNNLPTLSGAPGSGVIFRDSMGYVRVS
jgi:hypothetical protein